MTAAPRIAVVDDEEDLRSAVGGYLRLQGLDVVECAGGPALDAALSAGAVDLVLLDVTMPGEDGFAIARRLRADGDLGIIMLTARGDLIDRVVGLEIGADDYIAKPFELRELVARIRSVLRRSAVRAVEPTAPPATGYVDALWVQNRGTMLRVAVADILWIDADRDYVQIHTETRVHLLRATMNELEEQLDPTHMLRVHRSAFVRPSTIAGLKRLGRGGKLNLRDGRLIAIGPAYVGIVAETLRLTSRR